MKIEEFTTFLDENSEVYEYEAGEHDGATGYFVMNKNFETRTHFSDEAIKKNELNALTAYMRQGRNVENITRVTGFFSKVSAWNKGKTGELKDRHRNTEI